MQYAAVDRAESHVDRYAHTHGVNVSTRAQYEHTLDRGGAEEPPSALSARLGQIGRGEHITVADEPTGAHQTSNRGTIGHEGTGRSAVADGDDHGPRRVPFTVPVSGPDAVRRQFVSESVMSKKTKKRKLKARRNKANHGTKPRAGR